MKCLIIFCGINIVCTQVQASVKKQIHQVTYVFTLLLQEIASFLLVVLDKSYILFESDLQPMHASTPMHVTEDRCERAHAFVGCYYTKTTIHTCFTPMASHQYERVHS
jgi:hypothetical protein